MFRFGICTRDQYQKAGKQRRLSGSRVAFSLLEMGEHPTREEIEIFEDINFTLRTSNGTCRTTFRNRLQDLDAATIKILAPLYPRDFALGVEDRAVSHGLTSVELARQLYPAFPNARFEASDRLLHLTVVSFATGERYIVEPEGKPLQYINPPFVVSLAHNESRFLPINRCIAAWARRRLRRIPISSDSMAAPGEKYYQITTISCVHPEVTAFEEANPLFRMRTRSVFDITAPGVHLIRTMNILNKDYFSESQLREGAEAVFQSLQHRGIWIVGRTLETDFSNHASFLQKTNDGWQPLGRVGNGSEMEQFADLRRPTSMVPLQ
jgi:hypothetical protein